MPRGFTGWPRDKCRDTPRLQGVTLARPPAARKPPGPGTQPSPAYRAGVGSGEPHFPLGTETAPLTVLTGPPFSPGSQTVGGKVAKDQRPEPCLQGGHPAQRRPGHQKCRQRSRATAAPVTGRSPLSRAPFSRPAPLFSPPLLTMPRLSSPRGTAWKESAVRRQLPHPEDGAEAPALLPGRWPSSKHCQACPGRTWARARRHRCLPASCLPPCLSSSQAAPGADSTQKEG